MKIKIIYIFFFLVFIANIAVAASWEAKQQMLTVRNHLGVEVVNNKIYAIGGDGLTNNEEYDPVSNLWSAKSPMPTTRYWGFAAGVIQNKIYVIGGADAGFYLKTNEEYDPLTDTWTQKADMPTERFGLAVGVVGNKLYAIGGYNSTGVLSTNEEYDPATDTWTSKAPMPTARYYLTASVVNDKIYLIGGYNPGTGYLSTVEEYDPATNAWTSKTSMPTARGELASGVLKDTIYTVGGWNGVTDLSTNEAYDPTNDNWVTKTPMPTARSGLAVGVIADSLYAIGGLLGSNYLNTNEMYSPDITSIEIPSFNAEVNKSCVQISWRVSMETGYEFYKIKRKSSKGYKGIAVISSKGSSPSSQSYSYKDEDVLPGNRYEYSLGVVKNNGSTKWYGPVSVNIPFGKTFLSISPNPFTQKTVIRYSLSATNDQLSMTNNLQYPALQIYDASGRLIRSFPSSLFTRRSSVTWDGRDERGKRVTPGIYFIKLRDKNISETQKLIFAK